MPSRYHTTNPDRKISQGPASKPSGPGKGGTVNVRQSYTGMPLPGKASHAFAEAKRGIREVNGYAAYNGLSQSAGGSGQSFRQGSRSDEQKAVFENVMDQEGITVPMARSVGRLEYRGAMSRNGGNFQKAMNDLGGKAKTNK